ncbi:MULTISPECIES: hypothetical protein [unclassified Amycolatopsis]|uniref:hypothetical protein n=1 Tax=unclassified Amycolatopsis TaxID=2618356 RepID=UPI001FF4937F|nr:MULTISPECIES: hypothetical protein [unclassified Amycolatopsis]UOZ06875.1 hypothetical protein MUY22_00850 [Amycolatopsis sp. WQ 127309]WSJ73177.1 hypothetical protein OG439_27245 [Amycolatopsis sp. NBC_01307]WSK83096.1 hypothetical protein OG570_22020 [Amycolatopsis sp. NBC_01286]
MTTRGWQKERTLTTLDTVGREIAVTTGLTRDPEGRLVAVIAVGDGPTAIFRHLHDLEDRPELVANAADTADDLHTLTGIAPVRQLRRRR